MTASITAGNDGNWLSLGSVNGTNVPLTINSNNDGVISRSATVTLTYTYNTNQTTTKQVTVTQGVNPIYGSSTNPYTVAQAIAVIDAAGKTTVSDKYVTGIVSQVDGINSNAITYWISDDGTTTNQFEVYKGKSFNAANFSAVSDIQVGDEVVVTGDITYYSNSSVYEFASGSSIASLKLVAPAIYPASGAVGSGTEVTLSTLRTGATFYYTTDDSTPTASSTPYNSNNKPTITAATTFKAIAVKSDCTNSDVATASYTLLTPVATPEITLAGGTYSYAQTTTITCGTEGATIYYTTNGSNPTTSSTPYTGAISINETMTIKAIAAKSDMANSAVATATYTINIPVINASNVNIACDATSGSIPYTITNPDGGTLTAAITGGNEGSWLTCGAVNASAVALTCTANGNTSDRSATITLTYTYQTNKTVTKTVTVTQAGYFPTPTSDDYVRISSLDQLVDGCIVIIAARHSSTATSYYAMQNTLSSGKATGTQFTSTTSKGNEILPASLLVVNDENVQANYYWVVNVVTENENTYYTFTNSGKHIIGYGSSTSFNMDGSKTNWTISKSTSASTGPMVTSYSGFVINNSSSTDRDFAFNGTAFGAYSTGNNNMTNSGYNFYLDFFVQMPTYQLDILGHESSGHDWYLIASPVASVTPTKGNGFITANAEDYDFYRFNQSAVDLEWQNYKVHNDDEQNPFNALVSGQGYLYSNSQDVALYFTGHPYKGDGTVTLSYDDNAKLAGYNLIGNPYGVSATVNKDFYRMNSDGTEIDVNVSSGGSVAAMEGIFVVADNDDEIVTFTPESQSTPAPKNQLVMSLSRSSRGVAIDHAVIRFGEGSQLPKFMLNPENTKLYIPQGSEEYAIVSSEACGEMPVNFKAAKDGEYTLTVNAENVEMNYLHLIDNLTGADTDLLATPSYTFNARTTDYASRFRLLFGANNENGASTGSATFAYVSNGQVVVNGTGTLQVVDMLGRIVASQEVTTANCQLSTANYKTGVYVLRLVNNGDVKTQKMVIE